jgi:rSAM/selenodomain-associated transferase 1
MTALGSRRCVVVFGREPAAGRVKTRLAAGIGGWAAARVYAVTLDYTLAVTLGSGARVVLSLAGPPSGAWAREIDVQIELQTKGDLGDRMAAAFRRRFAEGETRVMIVGSDCPWMTAEDLRSAAAALDEMDVVLGPAVDGGYWLVGQRPPGVDLFTNIPWSSHNTLEKTRRRLAEIDASWIETEELRDIDTREDLAAALDDPSLPEDLRRRLRDAAEGR